MKNSQRRQHVLVSMTLVLTFIFSGIDVPGQEVPIIPAPVSARMSPGTFTLNSASTLSANEGDQEIEKAAAYLSKKIKTATGIDLRRGPASSASIQLGILSKQDQRLGAEGYLLEVNPSKVTVNANSPAGLFYGVQSLLQLMPKEVERPGATANIQWGIPSVSVMDYPRFAYRGVMLDVSRHFFSKEYVKEYIDQLSRFKFNRLHLHLTDDNGWRVEIKSLPRLTQVGAWRVPRTGTFGSNDAPKPGEKPTDGGFYTQDDIREIVRYASDRFIQILPEIDVPGHSMAAIAAYPELCVTKDTTIRVNPGSSFSKWFGGGKFEMYIDNTLNPADEKVYQFLDKVFTEIATLFPYEYIHIGGDECYKGYWERNPGVQAFMKKNNIKDSDGMQSYFTKRVAEIVASKKKKAIGWDEILEGGIAPNTAVMSWRGVKGGIEASHLKHPVVMSPAPQYYLDMMQGDASIEAPVYSTARLKDVYTFDILPTGIDSAFVMGVQGNLWTEQIPTEAQVEYMTYPRALAVAETAWSPEPVKNWNRFIPRVERQFERFDEAGINYSPSLYDAIVSVKKSSSGQFTIELKTEVEGLDIFYTVDNSLPSRYHLKYKEPFVFPAGADFLKVITYRNNRPAGRLISLKAEDLERRARR